MRIGVDVEYLSSNNNGGSKWRMSGKYIYHLCFLNMVVDKLRVALWLHSTSALFIFLKRSMLSALIKLFFYVIRKEADSVPTMC